MSTNWQVPFPAQLRSLQESNAPYNVWIGSVRSGKTVISIIRWLMYLRQAPDGDLLMVGATLESLTHNILNLIRELVGEKNYRYVAGRNEVYIFGRRIYVCGCPDNDAVNRITGLTLAGAYVDEIILMPQNFFDMLRSRLSIRGAKLFATTNPGNPSHYLKAFLEEPEIQKSLKVFQFFLEDNTYLDSDYIERIKAGYKGIFYKRYILGEWCVAEGAVYNMFLPDSHVISEGFPEKYDSYHVGIDWGMSNATAFLLCGVKNNEVFVIKEYYHTNRNNDAAQLDPNEYAEAFKDFVKGIYVDSILIDPSAKAFRTILQRKGYRLQSAANEVVPGITMVQLFLSQNRLKISKNCPNLIREIQGYVWDDKKALLGIDAPIKKDDHLLDALRYMVYTIFKKRGISGTHEKPKGW